MKGLTVLNLTMNNLSGGIPDAIGNIGALQQLYLQGKVPDGGAFRNLSYKSVAGNTELCSGAPQLHFGTLHHKAMHYPKVLMGFQKQTC